LFVKAHLHDLTQNVNFAIKARLVAAFLEAKRVTYKLDESAAKQRGRLRSLRELDGWKSSRARRT
jgi:hypothetical protein